MCVTFTTQQRTHSLEATMHPSPYHSSYPQVRVTFTTQRPSDYVMPYELLERHSVSFATLEKRSNRLATVVVGV